MANANITWNKPKTPQHGDFCFDPVQNAYCTWSGKDWIPVSEPGRMYIGPGNHSLGTIEPAKALVFNVSSNPERQISIDSRNGEVSIKGFEDTSSATKAFFNELMKHAEHYIIPLADKQKEIDNLRDEVERYERYAAEKIEESHRNALVKAANILREKFAGKKIIVTSIDEIMETLKNGK